MIDEYPKMCFSQEGEAIIVEDSREFAALDKSQWAESPAGPWAKPRKPRASPAPDTLLSHSEPEDTLSDGDDNRS